MDSSTQEDGTIRARSTSEDSSSTIIRRPEAATTLPFINIEDAELKSDGEILRPVTPTRSSSREGNNLESKVASIQGSRKRLPRKPIPRAASTMEGSVRTADGPAERITMSSRTDEEGKFEPVSTTESAALNSSTWMPHRSVSMPLTARNLWEVATEQRAENQNRERASEKSECESKKSLRNRFMNKLPKFLKSKKKDLSWG